MGRRSSRVQSGTAAVGKGFGDARRWRRRIGAGPGAPPTRYPERGPPARPLSVPSARPTRAAETVGGTPALRGYPGHLFETASGFVLSMPAATRSEIGRAHV